MKLKVSRKKDIINTRMEINEQKVEKQRKVSKTKAGFFLKEVLHHSVHKLFARLIRREKTQITDTKNGKDDITREYYIKGRGLGGSVG